MSIPLADSLRPSTLDEFIGQKHLVAKGKPIYELIAGKKVFSMLFWGPPGCGKTTLARIIADAVGLKFFALSAVSAGKNDLKEIVKSIKAGIYPQGSIVFLDEIHRFNKAQQDYLLPFVEDGTITLIGATTENPSFEVIGPLLSRCRVFVLNELTDKEIEDIVDRVLEHLGGGVSTGGKRTQGVARRASPGVEGSRPAVKTPQGLPGGHPPGLRDQAELKIEPAARTWLVNLSAGDARQVINLLDNANQLFGAKIKKEGKISLDLLKTTLQSPYLRYDKAGEEHYNTISSFLKSMRASNVDAALYYLARMVSAGEDPLFIARRMVVFASEDVATPTALVVANAVFRACETIGYPECQENLAAGTVYLCLAPKDRSAYDAYMKALSDVKQFGNLPIPLNLRNPVTKYMKSWGYGKGYEKYTTESLLPEKLKGKKYYVKKK